MLADAAHQHAVRRTTPARRQVILSLAGLLSLGIHMPTEGQPLVINELMALNEATIADPDFGAYSDWIEIYNPAPATATLDGFFLTDDLAEPFKWPFPTGLQVAAYGYLLVWADDRNSGLHANFRLSGAGESVGLYDAAGNAIDAVQFGPQAAEVSFGRMPDGSGQLSFFDEPTPGATNAQTGYLGIAPPPSFSIPRGLYTTGTGVELSTTFPASVIRYTTDGSPPLETSTVYSSPVSLSSTTVVRAAVFRQGYLPSAIVTNTYLVGESTALPIVSLATHPDNFFDDEIGIYVEGTNGIPGYCRSIPLNWNQDWERPVHAELFEPGGTPGFSLDAGVKIHGGCTRLYPQKSLAIFARSVYGTSRINYPIFEDRSLTSYNNLVLRTSAQDWWRTMFRDGMIQTLIGQAMDLETQAYRPAIMLLNGEYWGIHNLREKQNEHYFADHFGLDPDGVEILDSDSGNLTGQSAHYDEMMSYLLSVDMTRPEVLDVVDTYMDVGAYIDYLIAEIYSANADWPGNNLKLWRPKTVGGRWRWVIFDLDMGFAGNANSQYYSNTLALATDPNGSEWPNPPWSTLILRTLLKNPDFRGEFIQRFAAHVNTTFSPERVFHLIDSLRAQIAAEIPRHKQRWPQSISYSRTWDDAIQLMQTFATNRARYVRPHFYDYFGLSGSARLTLSVSDAAGGHIVAHGVRMPGPSIGAVFFRDVPVRLRAVASPGHRFERWEGLVQLSSDTVSVFLTQNADLTAVFAPDDTPTSVGSAIPRTTRLLHNYPNPFGRTTHIHFELAEPGDVSLDLYDVLGRKVATIADGFRAAGQHTVVLDGASLDSGVYFYRLRSEGFQRVRALSILR